MSEFWGVGVGGGVSCHRLSFSTFQCHMHNNTIFESLYVCKLTSHQISLPQKCHIHTGTKKNSSFIFACLKKKIEKGDNWQKVSTFNFVDSNASEVNHFPVFPLYTGVMGFHASISQHTNSAGFGFLLKACTQVQIGHAFLSSSNLSSS